jgi:hypothetical protein
MSETVIKAPGLYDREIDQSARETVPSGVPAGIAGATLMGPAFTNVTLGSFADFQSRFGSLDPNLVSGYAVQKWLENKNNLSFVRVLGCGANSSSLDFDTTRTKGTTVNAGMKVLGTATGIAGDGRHKGAVQFIAAKHRVTASEAFGFPMFTDNSSYDLISSNAYLIRGMIFTANDTRIMLMDASEGYANGLDDMASIDTTTPGTPTFRNFKLIISSSGTTFGNAEGFAGVKIFTASLNPSSNNYYAKLLNKDPEKFATEKHCLYADFAVDDEIATVASGSGNANSVVVLSGSTNTLFVDSSINFRDAFGRFDARYTTPKTTWFISQPFGGIEYDLFYIEAISDGAYATDKFKISIANIKASSDPRNDYGTFTVIVRKFDDTDFDLVVLEQFNNVSLNPNAENYIAKVIGDKKSVYNFDAESAEDRRALVTGKFANKSKYIRVVVNSQVERKQLPAKCLPFGFRGVEVLRTNDLLIDNAPSATGTRLAGSGSFNARLTGSIVPPLPFRFKATRGEVSSSTAFTGVPGPSEVADSRLFWGVKFERNTKVMNANVVNDPNKLVSSYSKFLGIRNLEVLVTGAGADTFNNNKFTLARVAMSARSISDITSSANAHMRESAYIRNGTVNVNDGKITDGAYGDRVTFATLLNQGTANDFNKFADYLKFSTILCGGWDGVNIFEKHAKRFDDRSTSTESSSLGYGLAASSYTSPGASSNWSGTGVNANAVRAYKTAVDILTDEIASDINILALPGQRDVLVTDYAAQANRTYGLSFYVMDVPTYDFNGVRIFDSETTRFPDAKKTANNFDGRAIDDDAVAAYLPNVVIEDRLNNRNVIVPATVAALAAIAYNDKMAYPWFVPAGFNRGALNFVSQTQVKINQGDRNTLFDTRINPVVKFPHSGFVFFSQNTLKQGKSMLTSVNVKRLTLEIQRLIKNVADKLIWENITPALRTTLVSNITSVLGGVQSSKGIERFSVICDNTNNTDADIDQYRMNCQIKFIPTTAVEYILLDYVITPTGVSLR